ncbi:cytochrome c biogenesis protein CcdA, partial [Pedobacter africanus]
MISGNYLTSVKALVIGLFLFLGTGSVVWAQEADTTLSDLEFTEISSDAAPADTAAVAPASTTKDSLSSDTTAVKADTKAAAPAAEKSKTLWETFIAGLVGGFLAFLMPCIFPMVPLTISYFTKRAGSKGKGIGQALIYGLSIIVIYVAFGLLITVIFGSAGLNALSASGLFNFLFFILLVVFAISFFGAFEITLPSSFVNKIDSKADNSKGLLGI